MTNDRTLWSTVDKYVPRGKWVAIADIFLIIQQRTLLDTEDLTRVRGRSGSPSWQSNVRKILHRKKREGALASRTSP
jgi:hypothetical protein